MPYLGIFEQKCFIWVFLGWNSKKKEYFHVWNQYPRICLIANFVKKWKCLNKGPNMSYLGIFGLGFDNNIVIFEIRTLEFAYLQNYSNKQKCVNLRPKMLDLGILGLEF